MGEIDKCAFCNPEELEDRRLSAIESPLVVSFLSDPRMTGGHALVVPRRHVDPSRDRLSSHEASEIDREMTRLRLAMLGSVSLEAAGVDIFQKTRPLVPEGHNGTKVDHLHFHVLPSKPGDELYDKGLSWGMPGRFKPLDEEEKARMIEVLRK